MSKLMKLFTVLMTVVFCVFVFNSCLNDEENEGLLNVYITDAPFPVGLVEEANITIDKISIRQGSENNDDTGDSSDFITLMNETATLNLLDLRNGLVYQVVSANLSPGAFDQIRLHVIEAEIVLTNGDVHDLKIPSGNTSGLKINIQPAIEVVNGLTSELLLDFDVSKSFVLQGNLDTPAGIQGFLFKPVIRASINALTGRIVGNVVNADESPLHNASVWVEKDTIVSTTFTDSSGNYAFLGIPAGIYSAHAAKDGFDTVSFDDIEVLTANQTVVNFQLDSVVVE